MSQDQQLLDRMNAENSTGPRLSTFCSQFKVEKKKITVATAAAASAGPGNKKSNRKRKRDNNNNNNNNTAATGSGGNNTGTAAAAGGGSDNTTGGPANNADIGGVNASSSGGTNDGRADGNNNQDGPVHPPAGVPVVQIVDGEIVLQESSIMLPTRRSVQEVEEEFKDNVVKRMLNWLSSKHRIPHF